MKELEILLENRLVYINDDKILYYKIKDSLKDIRDFVENKLGYSILVTPIFIKLEKLPGKAEPWMGIDTFTNKLEYAMLCMVLSFLEDKEKEEQFVLSQMTEYIKNYWPEDYSQLDWIVFNNRRHLVKVLNFCTESKLIKSTEGDDSLFALEENTEVLYENTGLSRYFMNILSDSIFSYDNYKNFEDEQWTDSKKNAEIIMKNRVYRRIVMSPVVYNDEDSESEYEYIKKYKQVIENDLNKYLNVEFNVYKNCAMLVCPDNKSYVDVYPNIRNISDIILQLSNEIRANQNLVPNERDSIILSYAEFSSLIETCRTKYIGGWNKTYREFSLNKLQFEIEKEMEYFNMISVNKTDMEVIIFPLACIIVGDYPESYYQN